MGDRQTVKTAPALRLSAVALVAGLLAVGAGQALASQSIDQLNSQISGAKDHAQALGAEIEQSTAALASAQQRAMAAAEREAQLQAVLDQGRARQAELQHQVNLTRDQLDAARAQLRRGLNALSNRLVGIYRSGMPDAATVLLNADGFDDLETRSEYLTRVEEADSSLVSRVRSLRDQVSKRLTTVEDAEQKAEDFADQVESARDQIAAVRAQADAEAARLVSLRDQRQAEIDSLQSQIGNWTDRVQHLERVSASSASGEVSEWFGDWAIPEAIVICESGGDFTAVNPSSGAGGAYQILPSTWELYGGHGAPQDASPAEQSEIAAQIWADSGAAAWECAG